MKTEYQLIVIVLLCIELILSACNSTAKTTSNNLPNLHFDFNRWRTLIKVNLEELEKNNCNNGKYSFEQTLGGINTMIPVWDSSDIMLAGTYVNDKFKDGILCLVSSENQGETYNSKMGIFWLKGKKCYGVTWENEKIKNIVKSKSAYKRLKKMSTICKPHLIAPGSKIIFTEIEGNNMWVKINVEPSIKQENEVYNFFRDK